MKNHHSSLGTLPAQQETVSVFQMLAFSVVHFFIQFRKSVPWFSFRHMNHLFGWVLGMTPLLLPKLKARLFPAPLPTRFFSYAWSFVFECRNGYQMKEASGQESMKLQWRAARLRRAKHTLLKHHSCDPAYNEGSTTTSCLELGDTNLIDSEFFLVPCTAN